MLYYYDSEKSTRIETDASEFTIDGIMSQSIIDKQKKSQWCFIAYLLYKFMSAEEIYKTHDKELLIIIEMFKCWRHYLQKMMHIIEILCDHNNLRYFMIITVLNERQS